MIPAEARVVRVPLAGALAPARAALLVRADEAPFAFTGAWGAVAAIAGGDPVHLAGPREDPIELLARQPVVIDPPGGAIAGGWFGFLSYGIGRRLEPVPTPPPAPDALPDAVLGFYDHVVVCDREGTWWFEALWTPARARILQDRLRVLAERLSDPGAPPPFHAGPLRVRPPSAAGQRAAVAECRERIAAGELFQANLALCLEAACDGDPAGLAVRLAERLEPDHGAYLAGPWGAVVSASPERFLRRVGRTVRTAPIKGTAPLERDGAALATSAKDRAENVMIVDLMRNDLGRVCAYGSITVPALAEPRPGAGVRHLVSEVSGTLRAEATDADLVRATFPPGSVTGAPKVQAMRVIAELESTAREVYTGAIGFASPIAGLELSVVIRTFELRGERIWLGAGGGITFGSDPDAEVEECFVKARPLALAADTTLEEPAVGAPAPAAVPRALAAGRERPVPGPGIFETVRVEGGVPRDLERHLERLRDSVRAAFGAHVAAETLTALPAVLEAAATDAPQRLRISVAPDRHGGATPSAVLTPYEPPDPAAPALTLSPWLLPGGLGPHKWLDRRLVDALAEADGCVPLLVDGDGAVLEAAWASVFLLDGARLLTPPADGRILPGVTRARLLELAPELGLRPATTRLDLDELARAPGLFLTSALRLAVPARLLGAEPAGPDPRIARIAQALRAPSRMPPTSGASAPPQGHQGEHGHE